MIEIVKKFGGTSVGSPARMKALPALIQDSGATLVVLSAVSGTTNALVAISESYEKENLTQAQLQINDLENHYQTFVKELLSTKESLAEAQALLKLHFENLRSYANDLFTAREEKSILAKGELLSTALFHLYLKEQGISSVLLSALDFMRINDDKEPEPDFIETHLKQALHKHPNESLFITQGYICRNSYGEIDNLKRGGSDYSASLIGAALQVKEIQIWTDIDGMHNNDPRIVNKTFPISDLSFDEAAELAYFGAKILHPTCILPAQKYNIPVRLLNTMQPDAAGTLISSKTLGHDIKAVAAKDQITALKIKSTRMLLAYGFLRNVFEVFERYKTPIDLITTSEVAVSLTIDDAGNLQQIVQELQKNAMVEVENELTIVCVVGDFVKGRQYYVLQVLQALANVPIRMISYGGSDNNVSILIKTEYKQQALQSLNDHLFSHSFKVAND